MATASSLGIGTGVDLNAMLTKIMAAERQPIAALNTKITTANTKLTVFGILKSQLSTLQTAASTLSNPMKLSALAATSSDATVTTASAAFNATAGSYSINVTNLAAAQKSFSNAQTSSATFGSGTLTFNFSGTNKTVELSDQASYTLDEVAAKINGANIGVSASVISGTDGRRLVFNGSSTGAAGAFTLSATADAVSGTTLSLNTIGSFDTTTTGLARAAAQDANLTIDGATVSSSTNTISEAITGISMTLLKTGSSTITVQSDSTTVTNALNAFIGAYNAVNSTIKQNSTYDVTTKTGKPLNAESSVRSIQSALNNARMSIPAGLSSGTYKTLSSIGVTIEKDGSLSLDSTKLASAMAASPGEVQKTLNAYGSAYNDALTKMLDTDGTVQVRVKGLNASIKSYNDNIAALEVRVANVEKRYRNQFSALDTLVSGLQTTSTYLTQQLAKL